MLQRQMPGLKIVMPGWFIPFHSEVFLGRVRVEQFSFSFTLWVQLFKALLGRWISAAFNQVHTYQTPKPNMVLSTLLS